ncbi:MAG TPA: peptidylprolyl isomerase [Thermoanaerobaculia bacterium]|nr:peptidylprolyl isomerase [Thermoanaerobaculia bacterium]HUM30412.1 peptidylprolyl isomerase [Thermoanaerobaculia bacterium]HXK68577.1 peptidylprolyl isomerase [Thermoanaerobaculia bacterium]
MNQQQESKKMAMEVNGRPISFEEIEMQTRLFLLEQAHSGKARPDIKEIDQLRQRAIEALVQNRLLKSASAREGLEVEDSRMKAVLDEIISSIGSDEKLTTFLQEAGISRDFYDGQIRDNLLIQDYLALIAREVEDPTEEEVKAFYEENKAEFKLPEQIRASHILVKSDEKDSEEEKQLAREKAEAILRRIEEGTDFAGLARSTSDCPSASEGGDLSFFHRGQMVRAFEDAAFGLNVGETSGIVSTRFGYHIITKTDEMAPRDLSFEEGRDKIVTFIREERTRKAIQDHILRLREEAEIVYHASTESRIIQP